MANIEKSLHGLRLLDDFARKDTAIHKIHPLIIFLVSISFIAVVTSFGQYEIVAILPLIFYPVIIFSMARIPTTPILVRALIVMPLILGIGLFAVIFDKSLIVWGSGVYYGGWFNFISLIIKYGLVVIAALLMISTTGIDKLSCAMRMIRIPKLVVLQIMLTYRYISVIGEQIAITVRAYRLRSYGKKGIHITAWGPLIGQLILRTFDRSQHIYTAMRLRGFSGDYHTGQRQKIHFADIVYLVSWVAFFVIIRIYNIPTLLGSVLTEVIK